MIETVRKLPAIGATAAAMALVFAFFADVPRAQAPSSGAGNWTSLFDGKTLAGWRGYRRPDASGTRWVVQEGMLCVDPKAAPSGRDLVTLNTYRDFDLSWEWRIAEAGNSGVKYLVLEDQNSAIGHEYQLADDERHPDATTGKRQTASFYDVLPATNRPLRPAGQMNESRIVVSGQTVQHWLNGTKVLEYTLDSPAVRAAIADSKFAKVERFGKPHQAHILLQDHNDPVCYRNIRIRARS